MRFSRCPRFSVPHVNAGDLLHAEVRARTPLGLEAEKFMHGSRTVPDRCDEYGCIRERWRRCFYL